MKKTLQVTIIAAFLVLLQTAAFSQVTINRAMFEAGFLNSQRTNLDWSYDSAKSFNMGEASGTAQSFNFSSIPSTADSMRDTTVVQYIPPTGLPGASNFPDATVAQKQVSYDGGNTITYAFYYQTTNDGVYGLGYGIHYIIPTVIDTIFSIKFHPSALFFPLPLTLGTQRTGTDSVVDVNNGRITVTTRTYNCNGYGTLTFPNGNPTSALRVQKDEVEVQYNSNGSFRSRGVKRTISFLDENISTCDFNVDTTFSAGTAYSTSFSYEMRTGVAGVREVSKSVPNGYELSQNFPNPFNPTTTINFKVSKEGFTTLKIFDVLGQEVATVLSKNLTPGSYSATWNASGVQSGVYFYKLQSGSYSETKKLILMK